MEYFLLAVLCWVMIGTVLVIYNSNGLSKIAVKKFPIDKPIMMLIYIPLWWLICILLIVIYPALYIRKFWIKK